MSSLFLYFARSGAKSIVNLSDNCMINSPLVWGAGRPQRL